VAETVAGIVRRNRVSEVIFDARGPAASLQRAIEDALAEIARSEDLFGATTVRGVDTGEHGRSWGLLVDGVQQRTFRHLGTPELVTALAGAVKRPLGESWAWSRKNSTADISPLVAVTLAYGAWAAREPETPFDLDDYRIAAI
jgi:hypothetical protein